MGCECCKPRTEVIPLSLPSKADKETKLESLGNQLLRDLEILQDNIKAPKNAAVSQVLWSTTDFTKYSEFLLALTKQTEALQRSPAIQLVGLPTEGAAPEEISARCKAMAEFITELRSLHEPGELPDSDWLVAVQQLVAKKAVLFTCKRRYEQLAKQCNDYQEALSILAEEGEPQVTEAKVKLVQKEVGAVLDGYFVVIQLTERVFQAISFLSRIALGMQTRIEALSGKTLLTTEAREQPVQQSDGLQMETLVRESAQTQ